MKDFFDWIIAIATFTVISLLFIPIALILLVVSIPFSIIFSVFILIGAIVELLKGKKEK
jgi:hypothetical protein